MNRSVPGLFLFLSALLLTACGGRLPVQVTATLPVTSVPSSTNVPTQVPTLTENSPRGTITLWHSLDEAQRPALLRSIAAYQKLYPDVQFDVLYVPSVDLKASFEAAMQEGGGPMILIGPAEWGAEFYDKGWTADLSTLASPNLLKRLNPAGLGTVQYRDHLVGLPVSLKGVVLYRNQELILTDPLTFDDLVLQAKAATSGEQIGAILERSPFFAGGHLMGLGGQLVDQNGEPAFNDEQGLAWLRLLGDFGQAGPVDDFTESDLNIFKEGRVGFIIDGTWNRGVLAEAIGPENLAIDPWPARDDEGKLSGFVQSDSIFLRQRTDNQDLSLPLSFVDFYLKPESQAGLLEVGLIPATLPEQLPPVETDPLLEQAMQALAGGTAYPTGIDFGLYSTALDATIQSVFEAGVPPAEALKNAEEAIRTAQSGQGVTPTP